ncbi:MAG: hypothetical protein COV31_01025 [Candidatus Yanofskybacteria bacterium CG10_big_fil_rev_8_21_14_0_10_46_23]|uniref:Uncharacterized protein n=1 Tax=Candidatus Yanofskybacteria bacterium CG10_big_fil_rev_8_21_14_0_10_46_23 TaxID=1975098 RepID=A0A2H0R4P0_9BACT|nr:MAG: hypothetical protein COV31_01025 [Candidatus Yanofskybacteria bacterium CG10_big_fil_rev_8_21_14_0_10_46_23]
MALDFISFFWFILGFGLILIATIFVVHGRGFKLKPSPRPNLLHLKIATGQISAGTEIEKMTNFLETLSDLHRHAQGWNVFLLGQPYLILNLIVQKNDLAFIVSFPPAQKRYLQNKLEQAFPRIRWTETDLSWDDPPAQGAVLTLAQNSSKTNEDKEALPAPGSLFVVQELQVIQQSFVDHERLYLQLLIRPSHHKKGAHLYQTNFRILTFQTTPERGRDLIGKVERLLERIVFARKIHFKLNFPSMSNSNSLQENCRDYRFDFKNSFYLTASELAAVYHFFDSGIKHD